MDVKVVSYLPVRVKEINDRLKANMLLVNMVVEGDAKRFCPVDTGRLRAAISSRRVDTATSVEGDIGLLADNHPYYGDYQEFGTSRMPAQPYLFPALESNKNKIIDILAKK